MFADLQSNASAAELRIGIAVSRYHHEVTDAMQRAAVEAFLKAGGKRENLLTVHAPGSFELVAICRAMALLDEDDRDAAIDAVVALGCIITGQTTHDQYIAHAVANGLAQITVETGVPVAFGVLTCQNMDQARARAGLTPPQPSKPVSNKGAEAMLAAIEAANAIRGIYAAGRGER